MNHILARVTSRWMAGLLSSGHASLAMKTKIKIIAATDEKANT